MRIRAEPLSSALLDIVASSNSSLDQFRDTLLRLRELDDPEARRSEDGGSGAVDDGPTTLSSQTHVLPAVRERCILDPLAYARNLIFLFESLLKSLFRSKQYGHLHRRRLGRACYSPRVQCRMSPSR